MARWATPDSSGDFSAASAAASSPATPAVHPRAATSILSPEYRRNIEVSSPERRWRVQVKTVSAYSTTRTISPIHRGWDQLLVVYLGRDFKPRGFWVITDTSIVAPGKALASRKCPFPDGRRSGSKGIPWGENQVDEFMKLVGPQIQVGD